MSTELKEVIETLIYNTLDSTYTSLPATVVKVNTEGDSIKSVDCQSCIQKIYRDGVVGVSPIIYNVPVIFPSAGGGILSFPVSVGDTVLCVYGMRDMENFLEGNIDTPPKTKRLHNITDAVAIVGLYPPKENLDPSKDKVELKYKGSKVSISSNGDMELEAPSVTIKGDVDIDGDIEISGTVTNNGIDIGETHIHTTAGTPSDPPALPPPP